jgi:aromatic ring-opening dioxygenase LigB subunit
LIPDIGKENFKELVSTANSLKTISKRLADVRPETIVCLSNHAINSVGAVVINIQPQYEMNFEEYGEYGMNSTIPGDPVMAYHLKQRFDTLRLVHPVVVISQKKLDSSLNSPLFYLLKGLPQTGVIPIGDTIEEGRSEFIIGERLRRPIYQERRRIAVIVSANLSHRLSPDSPAGYSPKAKDYDERVLKAISKKHPLSLQRFKPETISEVQECGLRPLLMLFGILQDTVYEPEILSYESPFGIGYAVIHLRL